MTQLSNEVLLESLKSLQVGILIVNAQYQIVYCNDWIVERLPESTPDIIDTHFFETFADLTGSRLDSIMKQVINEGLSGIISASFNRSLLPLYAIDRLDEKNRKQIKQMTQLKPIHDKNGQRFALIQISDMSNVIARELQLREQADTILRLINIDHLTNIANRRKFDETLQEEFKRAQRAGTSLVVSVIDIDHFKLYNDHYGHPQGDRCLEEVARCLNTSLRRENDLVARYGGEEFGLIMPGSTFEGAVKFGEALRERIMALRIRNEPSPTNAFLTISLGLAYIIPKATDSHEALLSSADFALYQAKHLGRNKAMIYSLMDNQMVACA